MGFAGRLREDFEWKPRSAAQLPIRGRKVAIIGGTGGLGRALALSIARHGGDVVVVGRTFRDAGVPNLTFLQADLDSMREARRVGQALSAEVDTVVFTTGIIAAKKREETAEGLERDMAVSYLSRFVITRELAPRLVAQARTAGRRPRVFIMGFPGTDSKANVDDLMGEKRYSAMEVHMNTVVGNEVLVLDSAKRYPELDVFGLNPGLIKTDIRSNLLGAGSLKHRVVEWFIGLLSASPEDYAGRIVPLLFAPELEQRSGAMFNNKALAIHASKDLSEAYVRDFTARAEALVERAVGKASV